MLQEVTCDAAEDSIGPMHAGTATGANANEVDAGAIVWNAVVLGVQEPVRHSVVEGLHDLANCLEDGLVRLAQQSCNVLEDCNSGQLLNNIRQTVKDDQPPGLENATPFASCAECLARCSAHKEVHVRCVRVVANCDVRVRDADN